MKKLLLFIAFIFAFTAYGQREINGTVTFPDTGQGSPTDSIATFDNTFMIKWLPKSAIEQQLSLDGNNLTISGTGGNVIDLSSISGGGGVWGSITGTLSNQTDLQSALDAKQATLVSGTNIRTINGNDILGSGDLVISGGGGVSDHGLLTGLGDDDHTQYHTDARALSWLTALYADLDTDNTDDVIITTGSPDQPIEIAVGTFAQLQALPAPTGSTVRLEFPTDDINNPATDYYAESVAVAGTSTKTITIGMSGGLPDLTAQFTDEGSGAGGDMLKATYDVGDNGVVDNAENLNGQAPAFYLDDTDEQTLSFDGSILSISKSGSSVDISGLTLTESEVDAFVNNNGYLLTEVDGSISNELQTISKVGSTVTLSNGGGSFNDDNTQLSEEQVEDYVGTMVTSSTDGLVYNDAGGTLAVSGILSSMITDNAVTTNKLINNAATESKIADGAVSANKLASNAVTTIKINNAAVTVEKMSIDASVLPTTSFTYDLGSQALKFRNHYLWGGLFHDGNNSDWWLTPGPSSGDYEFRRDDNNDDVYGTIYTLNESGTPSNNTDLITKSFADSNYGGTTQTQGNPTLTVNLNDASGFSSSGTATMYWTRIGDLVTFDINVASSGLAFSDPEGDSITITGLPQTLRTGVASSVLNIRHSTLLDPRFLLDAVLTGTTITVTGQNNGGGSKTTTGTMTISGTIQVN